MSSKNIINSSDIERNKSYYKYLDILRIFLCISVFLYHLGYLKGGFLAVNVFFALSGYFAYTTSYQKDNFSIKDYYKKRLKGIYLPLVIVVFLSLVAVSFIHSFKWLNLKTETISVLFGYNNFWQLGASLDYFSRHIDSPFMHLWYISILMQFDLVFPIIYKIFAKTKEKLHRAFPAIVTFLVVLFSFLAFYYFSVRNGMMTAYYNTFCRLFSIFFGILVAIIHTEKVNLIPESFKSKTVAKLIILFYLLLLLVFFFFVDASSHIFQLGMIIVTIIAGRLLDYSTCIKDEDNKILKIISSYTYVFYLVQYPVIFSLQYVILSKPIKLLLICLITLIATIIITYAVNYNAKKKGKAFKLIVLAILLGISCYGGYILISSKNYSNEMKELEKQLSENHKMIKEKQEAYAKKLQEQRDELTKQLELIENDKNNIDNIVKELPVIGIGDSVMLGAVNNLYNRFANGYFDAQVSRSTWVVNGILQDINNKNMLGDPVVINMGANGDCSEACKDAIMATCGERKVFWLTNTNVNTLYVNDTIKEYATKHDNLYIIDWYKISQGHDEYFYADGIHLTIPGREAYADAIYQAILDVYVEEYSHKTEKAKQVFEETMKNKYEFYGNDLLLSAYQYLVNDFIDSKFNISSSYNYDSLKSELLSKYKDGSLSNRVVLVIDSSFKMSQRQYNDLISLLGDTQIFLTYIGQDYSSSKNTKVFDFNDDLANNSDYLISDSVHLSTKGSKAIANGLIKFLNNEE